MNSCQTASLIRFCNSIEGRTMNQSHQFVQWGQMGLCFIHIEMYRNVVQLSGTGSGNIEIPEAYNMIVGITTQLHRMIDGFHRTSTWKVSPAKNQSSTSYYYIKK